jgi:hypothetical protein
LTWFAAAVALLLLRFVVHSTGVTMKDNPKAFTVVPESLELFEIIGKGSSSYVQRAVHAPSGTQLALKVINIFDKSKRDQLTKEIQTLYDADCDWCACLSHLSWCLVPTVECVCIAQLCAALWASTARFIAKAPSRLRWSTWMAAR